MTSTLWLRDLLAYSLQIALLVGAGALLARLLALRPPAVALGFWRLLLAGCLLLPLGQPWNQSKPEGARPAASDAVLTSSTASREPGSVGSGSGWPKPRVVLGILAAGVAARGLWLALGFWTLARLRRRGRPIEDGRLALEEAQRRLGVRADFFTSEETAVPITFGVLRPAVLLPAAVLAMEPPEQQAILYHELIHVRRRDWVSVVCEEGVRALLWFHPAVAWLIGRIHLSREQAVDRAVVEITESRDAYVGALLAVARATARPQLVPAPLFLRKSRLKQRVAEIFEEGTMTKKRLAFVLATCGCAALLAAGAGARLFPLEVRASDSQPIQVLRGGEGLLHGAPLEYPRLAIERRVEGDVLLELSVDERGEVQDARVLSGPEELRAAALRSVLRWHYAPPAAPLTTQVQLQFKLPAESELSREAAEKRELAEKKERHGPEHGPEQVERQIEELQKALEDPGVSPERRERYERQLAERKKQLDELAHGVRENEHEFRYAVRLPSDENAEAEIRRLEEKLAATASGEDEKRWKKEIAEQKKFLSKLRSEKEPLEGRLLAIHSERLSPEALATLVAQLGVGVGDSLDAAAIERIRHQVARYDEHVRVGVERMRDGGLVLILLGP